MATHLHRRQRPLVLALAAGLTLAGTGVAFAYWTSDGTGTGIATTGESTAFVVTSDDPVGEPLSPAGPLQTVDFTVTNPSSGNQLLEGMFVRVALPNGEAWTSGQCSAADYNVSISTVPALGPIAPGESVGGTATIQMRETGLNQNDCQNATVPLYFETNPPL